MYFMIRMVCMAAGQYFLWMHAPEEASMGLVQKIFYFHLPLVANLTSDCYPATNEKLLRADAMILGSPTYFTDVTSEMNVQCGKVTFPTVPPRDGESREQPSRSSVPGLSIRRPQLTFL